MTPPPSYCPPSNLLQHHNQLIAHLIKLNLLCTERRHQVSTLVMPSQHNITATDKLIIVLLGDGPCVSHFISVIPDVLKLKGSGVGSELGVAIMLVINHFKVGWRNGSEGRRKETNKMKWTIMYESSLGIPRSYVLITRDQIWDMEDKLFIQIEQMSQFIS